MSDRTSKVTPIAASAADAGGSNLPMPDFARLTSTMMNNMSAMNGRMMSFAQTSVQNGMEAAGEFRRCQTAQELMDAQMRFAQKAYTDYLDEAREMGAIIVRMSSEAVEMMQAR
ncbi:MAG: phasin family protein [Alphaproteobacteria bacterium]|nr:phasin family protein [Alphaproteobacteria bacterium]